MHPSDKESRVTTDMSEVDLLVCGAGAGGMTAALVGALEGLQVLLVEKTGQVGGTTSTSGGTTWVPGNSLGAAVGCPDEAKDADAFLRHVVGNRGGDDLRQAFLASGAAAIDDLAARSEVRFAASAAHPDYLDGPGSAFGGRALGPLEFDGRRLGRDFDRVRPPRPEFMGLGGMMAARTEIDALLNPFRSVANFRKGSGIVLRYLADRLRYRRGTRLLMGNALAARLFYSLRRNDVPILFDTAARELLVENGRVVGLHLETPEGDRIVRARRGVVLATGGIGWNGAIRQRLFPEATRALSLAPATNTGDGADLATRAGAGFQDGGDSPALWMPCSSYRRADGHLAVWPHILLDRAKPGLLAVNASGRRFVNESDSYHDFSMGQIRAEAEGPSMPSWLICDEAFIRRYGLGLVLPGGRGLARLQKAGYVLSAPDLSALSALIGVDAVALRQTIADYNAAAETGGPGDHQVHAFARECRQNVVEVAIAVQRHVDDRAGVLGNLGLKRFAQIPQPLEAEVLLRIAGHEGAQRHGNGAAIDGRRAHGLEAELAHPALHALDPEIECPGRKDAVLVELLAGSAGAEFGDLDHLLRRQYRDALRCVHLGMTLKLHPDPAIGIHRALDKIGTFQNLMQRRQRVDQQRDQHQ